MIKFAKNTKVNESKSKGEIEKTLRKYGAHQFAFATDKDKAIVLFEINGKRIKFIMPLLQPPPSNAKQASIKTYEQDCRQRWRILALAIKAKLEIVESRLTTFEAEFMAHIVLPNGDTAGKYLLPQIDQAYENKNMPPMLGM
jgi:hypothetical protein